MANVDTPRTADMMKRAIAILTSEKELLDQIRWKHTGVVSYEGEESLH